MLFANNCMLFGPHLSLSHLSLPHLNQPHLSMRPRFLPHQNLLVNVPSSSEGRANQSLARWGIYTL